MNLVSKGALAVAGVLLMSACERVSNKTDAAVLAGLRDSGIAAEARAKNDERLEKVLGRDNGTGALKGPYGALTASSGASLGGLMQDALQRNTDIGRAAQDINLAHVQRLNAIMGYLPQVSISIQRDQLDQKVVDSDNQVFQLGNAQYQVDTQVIRLVQPIVDISRVFGIRQATTARTLAEVNYIKAVKDTMASVFDTYVTAHQSKTRAAALQARLRLIDRQVAALEGQIAAGEGNFVQPEAVRSDRATLAADLAFERSRLSASLGQLSRLTGRVVSDVSGGLPSANRGAAGLSAQAAVQAGMRENSDIMAAALSVVISDMEKKQQAYADFAPVLIAYATLEREARGNSRFGGGSTTDDTTIGLRLTIPIFNANGEGISSLEATVAERAAALEYYATKSQVEAEIRATLDRMRELSAAQSSAAAAASAARRALGRERARVTSGEAIASATLSHEIRVNTAQERAAFFQGEYLRAWGRLQHLTGLRLDTLVR